MMTDPEDEPVIHFAHHLIQSAIHQGASDIHIEPLKEHYRIRFREDGLLRSHTFLPIAFVQRVVMRFKVMAQLDITERRIPQDGQFEWQNIPIRMNTCPTLFGEKMALRLLYLNPTASTDFSHLGLNALQENIVRTTLSKPHGLILIAGPTGSGKTTTLYALLHYLNCIEKNIITIEDPIEIQLEGVNQVNVRPKIGLDFSTLLRTLLRQDPDILMVGEIRDLETAETAIRAAQTGHLVLSTVHAKNIPETLLRLMSLGVKGHDLASSVSLMITQRLLRKWNGKQYQGRIGIYEVLSITPSLAALIETQEFAAHHFQKKDHTTLYQSGIEKIEHGITTHGELKRVIG